MAACYGLVQGSRGAATRLGGVKSGIRAHLRTWNADCYFHLSAENELTIRVPENVTVRMNGVVIQEKPAKD